MRRQTMIKKRDYSLEHEQLVDNTVIHPVEINDEIGIGLKAGIGVGRNMEDAAYMADLGLEEIRDHDNGMWTWVIEKEY